MSVRDILANALKEPDIRNARYVRIRGRIRQTGNVIRSTTITTVPGEKPRLHKQEIKTRDPSYTGKMIDCPAVVISCDCIAGDSRVLTDKGWQTVYSLVDPTSDHLTENPINYIVHGKIYPGSVPYYKGIRRTYKVTFDNGYILTLTKNHPLRVYVGVKQKHFWEKRGRARQDGINNGNALIWKIIFRDGTKVITKEAKVWASKNNYNYKNCLNYRQHTGQGHIAYNLQFVCAVYHCRFFQLFWHCHEAAVIEQEGPSEPLPDHDPDNRPDCGIHIGKPCNLNIRKTNSMKNLIQHPVAWVKNMNPQP